MRRPIFITVGDPAGVGAEVALKALVQGAAHKRPVTLVGDLGTWKRAAALVGAKVAAVPLIDRPAPPDAWPVWTPPDGRLVNLPDAGDHADEHLADRGRVLTVAIVAALRAIMDGLGAAIVTMPIDKRALHAYGDPHPGHTELIADLLGVPRPVMMLFGPGLRVVPITTHVALRQVPDLLTETLVLDTLRVVHHDLQRLFGVIVPRLGVCALNPHAGEGGLFGDEEQRVLAPAIRAARQEGIEAEGPLAADSAFADVKRYDVLICPTHDQALIPLKQQAFDRGVNITLGLPVVRTSPDHGTARDIAWTGQASPASAAAAIAAAVEITERLERQ